MSRRQPKQQSKTGLGAKELYLVGYNLASAGAWAYILLLCVQHLRQPPPPVSALPSSTFSSSTKMLLLSSSAYASLGKQVTWVQTAAIFDAIHVILGLVRTKLFTTVSQVFSRFVIVWGVLYLFPATQTSPFFLPMIMAWCIAEIIRYVNYAAGILNVPLPMLETLRYSLFYVLYPVGAGSENMHMWAALPWAEARFGSPAKWVLVFLAGVVWPISLVLLMTYMHGQRRKHLRGKKKAQ